MAFSFFKWSIPGLFFEFIFVLFRTNTIFTKKINVKNVYPEYGAYWYTNPLPSLFESQPITTRPYDWYTLAFFKRCCKASSTGYWKHFDPAIDRASLTWRFKSCCNDPLNWIFSRLVFEAFTSPVEVSQVACMISSST